MLNYIWFALMAIALVVAIFMGTAPAVTKGAIDSAKTAVEIALGLVGIMTLWLGIMKVAAAAGPKNPTAIIPTTLIASLCGTIAAVTASKILQRFSPREEKPAEVVE